jgi:DNA topoisomerase-2
MLFLETFSPVQPKFNMERLDEDTVALLSRRAYDVAASSKGVKVMLNGKRIPVKVFNKYSRYSLNEPTDI